MATEDRYTASEKGQRAQINEARDAAVLMYKKQLDDAGAAYRSLKNEAYVNKALSDKATRAQSAAIGNGTDVSQTVWQRGDNAVRNALGKIDRQQKQYTDSVDLALNNLETRYLADTSSLSASAASQRSAAEMNQGQFDAEKSLKERKLSLAQSDFDATKDLSTRRFEQSQKDSAFDQNLKLFSKEMIDPAQFKAATGIEVKKRRAKKKKPAESPKAETLESRLAGMPAQEAAQEKLRLANIGQQIGIATHEDLLYEDAAKRGWQAEQSHYAADTSATEQEAAQHRLDMYKIGNDYAGEDAKRMSYEAKVYLGSMINGLFEDPDKIPEYTRLGQDAAKVTGEEIGDIKAALWGQEIEKTNSQYAAVSEDSADTAKTEATLINTGKNVLAKYGKDLDDEYTTIIGQNHLAVFEYQIDEGIISKGIEKAIADYGDDYRHVQLENGNGTFNALSGLIGTDYADPEKRKEMNDIISEQMFNAAIGQPIDADQLKILHDNGFDDIVQLINSREAGDYFVLTDNARARIEEGWIYAAEQEQEIDALAEANGITKEDYLNMTPYQRYTLEPDNDKWLAETVIKYINWTDVDRGELDPYKALYSEVFGVDPTDQDMRILSRHLDEKTREKFLTLVPEGSRANEVLSLIAQINQGEQENPAVTSVLTGEYDEYGMPVYASFQEQNAQEIEALEKEFVALTGYSVEELTGYDPRALDVMSFKGLYDPAEDVFGGAEAQKRADEDPEYDQKAQQFLNGAKEILFDIQIEDLKKAQNAAQGSEPGWVIVGNILDNAGRNFNTNIYNAGSIIVDKIFDVGSWFGLTDPTYWDRSQEYMTERVMAQQRFNESVLESTAGYEPWHSTVASIGTTLLNFAANVALYYFLGKVSGAASSAPLTNDVKMAQSTALALQPEMEGTTLALPAAETQLALPAGSAMPALGTAGALPALTAGNQSLLASSLAKSIGQTAVNVVKALQSIPASILPQAEYQGLFNAYLQYGLNPTEANAIKVLSEGSGRIDSLLSSGVLSDEMAAELKEIQAEIEPYVEKSTGNVVESGGGEVVDIKYPGNDPIISPGENWNWRGKGAQGSSQGSYYNSETDESLHPDLDHPGDMPPHWDYRDSNGVWYRIFEDGTIKPK